MQTNLYLIRNNNIYNIQYLYLPINSIKILVVYFLLLILFILDE